MKALRWAAALPVGIALGVVALFPIHWVVLVMHWYAAGADELSMWDLPPDELERALNALIVPGVIIVGSAATAPDHHFRVAVAVAIAIGTGLGLAQWYFWTSPEWEISVGRTVIVVGLWSISIVGGLYEARKL